MEKRMFSKTIVFSFIWAIFLSLLIINWNGIKSAQWQDLWETIASVIRDSLIRNAGFVFLFSFVILVMAKCFRHNRLAQIGDKRTDNDEWQKRESIDAFMQEVDMDCDPAYSHLVSNIHHEDFLRNHWEWKS